MISVENFYWILYSNLLEPSGLDAWYYYPFGTQENFSSVYEFPAAPPVKHEHHVLFHFDQEPISEPQLGKAYELKNAAWCTKNVRVLANSEHSDLKKNLCRSRGMHDWYYFYHGFAALDWFRDCRYITDIDNREISNVYISFNHLVTGKRAYRMALAARLEDLDATQFGATSFHGTRAMCERELRDPCSELSPVDKNRIQYHLDKGRLATKLLDTADIDASYSARVGHREYRLWQKSFVHLVNETVFFDPKSHLTEKIFKPIVALRPFILAAAPGNLAYLRSYGFQTFEPWIDESYDLEPDPGKRLDMIASEIAKLCSKSLPELRLLQQEMMPVLQFNKKHFFGDFRRIIVDELVENFDACIRVWNNGRLDGRERPRHPDLRAVKELLLR